MRSHDLTPVIGAARPRRARLAITAWTKVAFRRAHLGLTQQEVADRAGLHREHVAKIERGQCNPTMPTANALASALETTVAELWPLKASGTGPAETAEPWPQEWLEQQLAAAVEKLGRAAENPAHRLVEPLTGEQAVALLNALNGGPA